jgi:hypothetical protein
MMSNRYKLVGTASALVSAHEEAPGAPLGAPGHFTAAEALFYPDRSSSFLNIQYTRVHRRVHRRIGRPARNLLVCCYLIYEVYYYCIRNFLFCRHRLPTFWTFSRFGWPASPASQVPDLKPKERLAEEVRSVCCLCSAPFNVYQGKYCCSRKECKVPVIVCHKCCGSGAHKRATLLCPLCKEGHSLRELPLPDLVGQKRRLAVSKSGLDASSKRIASTTAVVSAEPSHRLFVGKLPLTITATSLRHALLGSSPGSLFSADHLSIEWLTDRKTSLFYGSAFVGMPTVDAAAAVVARGGGGIGLTVPGSTRRARVAFRPLRDGEEWPREGHVELERPPVPTTPHPHPSRTGALAAK